MLPRKVHLVFKSHLDIGFTGLAGSILRKWHEEFFPLALETAAELRKRGGPERFTWTTSAWMIQEHLERVDAAARRRTERAITGGDLGWHALPFTLHGEICDASLYDEGLAVCTRLDQRFGKQTLAAKHSDVPGETIGIVPLLAARGVCFLHIGVNPCVAAPDAPALFRWRAPCGGEIVVAYAKRYYGGEVWLPGRGELMIIAHENDNRPPPGADKVLEVFATVRRKYPQAEIVAGDMNAFAARAWQLREKLPLVTTEIGNSWIHGCATDPWKLGRFRALSAWRREQLARRPSLRMSRPFREFSQQLLLVAEHTGGLDNKVPLTSPDGARKVPPFGSWQRDSFLVERRKGLYAEWEASWREQRDYLRNAVEALGDGPLAQSAMERLDSCQPRRFDPAGWTRADAGQHSFRFRGWRVKTDPRTGSLVGLREEARGRDWASRKCPLACFSYEVLSADTYETWWRDYGRKAYHAVDWARGDFLKHGLEGLPAHHDQRWHAPVQKTWSREEDDRTRLLMELAGDPEAVKKFGCPERITVEWEFPHAGRDLQLAVQWFNKRACRIPESAWLSIRPKVADERDWRYRKLGTLIDPRKVVSRGGRRLHGVESCTHPACDIELLDAGLVAPDRPQILRDWRKAVTGAGGIHVNLQNNIWGTNFPMWHEDDARFVFRLILP